MRTILIATDFSEAARRAALYGLQLAKAFNARIILLHAYQQGPVQLADSLVVINREDLSEIVHRQLTDEVACLGVENDLPIQVMGVEGHVAETVLDTACRLKADIVVCGMKAAGLEMRKMFGSSVTDMTRMTRIPLLVVPESVKFENPHVLALAEDIHPDADVHILDMLRSIAQRFRSKLYMINVVTPGGDRGAVRDAGEAGQPGLRLPALLRKALQTLDPVYVSRAGDDVIRTLQEAVHLHGVNMLAMVPHHHSFLERWMKGSHTKAMIFETSIPLLILPDLKRKSPIIMNV